MAFQRDLRRYRFGWRQAVPFVAVVAMVASTGAGLGGALNGRWQVVDEGYEGVLSFLDGKAPAHARTFWLGDADVLPVNGWVYDDDLTFSITHARTPTVLDSSPGNADDTTFAVRQLFEDTLSGASNRLGQRLALHGIRYIAVFESNAPAPSGSLDRPVDAAIKDRLREQLDLVRVDSFRPGATVYENRAYVPTVSAFAPGVLAATSAGSAPGEFALALPEVTSLRSYRGALQPGEIFVAAPFDSNWSLNVNGQAQPRSQAFGWAQVFAVEQPGTGVLAHSNESTYWFASLVQVGVWLALVTVLILGRRRRT